MGRVEKKEHTSYALVAAVALTSAIIVFLREPSIFVHAQFWGEDGKYWYAQAYNHGPLLTLFWPYAGSLQLAMRLIGSLSLLLPVGAAPLFFAIAAGLIQVLPAVLLVTKRFQKPFGSLRISLLVAFFYLLIPNSFEIHANLTNINWHLALLALMVIIVPRTSNNWKYFDYAVLAISGLTGPFSVLLFPIAWYFWRLKKTEKTYVYLIIATAAIQFVSYMLSHGGSRLSRALGANLVTPFSIIGGRITTALFVGMNDASSLIITHHHIFSAIGALTLLFAAYLIWKAPIQLKAFVVFSWLSFFVALAKPQASLTVDQWPAILQGAGNRYFFLPMLSIFLGFVWLAASKTPLVKYTAITAIVFIFCFAVRHDFTYMARPSTDFNSSVSHIKESPKGQVVCFNVNPGPDWRTCLKKH